MQLSLPSLPSATPAAPKAGCTKNSSTSGITADPTDAAAESFDSLLPKNGPAAKSAKPADDKSDSDSEQTAAILTAGFWMPMVQSVAPTPDPTALPCAASSATECSTAPAGTALAAGSAVGAGLFTATSPRAFRAGVQSGIQSVKPKVGSDPKTVLPVVPDSTTEAAKTPTAANPPATAAAVVNSQMTAQDAGVSIVLPAQIPGIVPVSANRSGGTPTTISTDKSTRGGTELSSDAEPQVAVPSDATGPMVQVSAHNHSGRDAKSTESTDLATAIPSKEGTDETGSFASGVAKAATALVDSVANKLVNSAQEKIAALTGTSSQSPGNPFSGIEKYFLNATQKGVATAVSTVGTGVAKVNATMAAATAPTRQKSDSTNESPTSFVFSADPAPTATLTLDAPAPVATVRETMAAVISAVDALERRADVQQKSVDLQFHVGNEKLGLRVELRDGAVHTTFRTESSEMNSALTHEWHAVVQPAFAREIHLAEPVFHSASTSGNAVPAASSDSGTTAFGNGAQQQREQPQPPPAFASVLKREFYESASAEAAPASAPVSNSSQLLNALA